jgi:hypothetical protein
VVRSCYPIAEEGRSTHGGGGLKGGGKEVTKCGVFQWMTISISHIADVELNT